MHLYVYKETNKPDNNKTTHTHTHTHKRTQEKPQTTEEIVTDHRTELVGQIYQPIRYKISKIMEPFSQAFEEHTLQYYQ